MVSTYPDMTNISSAGLFPAKLKSRASAGNIRYPGTDRKLFARVSLPPVFWIY